jgi:hypothetical protein
VPALPCGNVIHTVLALEQLGLDPTRDNISILPIGDPSQVTQALEPPQESIREAVEVLMNLMPRTFESAPDTVRSDI